jgi:hypothetical protein
MRVKGSTQNIQAVVPRFAPEEHIPEMLDYMSSKGQCVNYFDTPLDWARDHFHFDIKTSSWIVDQLDALIM